VGEGRDYPDGVARDRSTWLWTRVRARVEDRVMPSSASLAKLEVPPTAQVDLKRLLNGMQRGEVLRLIGNCPRVTTGVPGSAHATGMQLVDTRETAPGEYEFCIRKR